MRVSTLLRLAGLSAAALCASIMLRGDARSAPNLSQPATLTGSAPATMLWAWEEPENLRGIDPGRVGVAFLAERVFLGKEVQVYPRRQNILVPDNTYAVAVVRIEVSPGFVDSSQLRHEAADAVLRAAELASIRGIQVDFDATASQQDFYVDVLRQVRSRLPESLGLTMTALVSWCSAQDGWLRNMPVDAAVPMYFRLGKHAGEWEVREPLCAGNVGVSLDERGTAPAYSGGVRTYVFSSRPWTREQVSALNRAGFPSIARSKP